GRARAGLAAFAPAPDRDGRPTPGRDVRPAPDRDAHPAPGRDVRPSAGSPVPDRNRGPTHSRDADPAPSPTPADPSHRGATPSGPGTVDASPGVCVVQSVLTGNVRPMAEMKLGALGLDGHLDLEAGAYGESHEIRSELVHLARGNAARRYGTDFAGTATVLVGDTPLDVAAARATGARAVAVATGGTSADKIAAAGAGAAPPHPPHTPPRPPPLPRPFPIPDHCPPPSANDPAPP